MAEFSKTELNKIKRGPKRASYDEDEIWEIIKDNFIAHLSFIYDGK